MKEHKLKLLTIATSEIEEDRFKLWEKTAKYFNYDYTILARNVKWNTFNTKIKYFYEAMRKIDHEYVALTDSLDLFFCAGPDVLLKKFQELGQDHIIGGEIYFPYQNNINDKYDKHTLEQHFRSKTTLPHCYPNSGFIMGKRETLIEIYSQLLNDIDDQTAYINVSYERKYLNKIDAENNIIANITQSENKILDSKNVTKYLRYDPNPNTQNYTFVLSNAKPVMLHFPGGNYKTMYRLYNQSMGRILGEEKDKNVKNNDKYEYDIVIMIFIYLIILIIFIIIIYLLVRFATRDKQVKSFYSNI